jgi:dUTPase
MGARFEIVSKYANAGLELPTRKTAMSAGYDLAVAQDIIIEPYQKSIAALVDAHGFKDNVTLEEMAALTKAA